MPNEQDQLIHDIHNQRNDKLRSWLSDTMALYHSADVSFTIAAPLTVGSMMVQTTRLGVVFYKKADFMKAVSMAFDAAKSEYKNFNKELRQK